MTADMLVIAQARLLDTLDMTYQETVDIVIANGRVRDIVSAGTAPPDVRRIDVVGRTVIPGLIDAHVHVIGSDGDYARLARTSPYLVAARSALVLRDMLMRGFTTVRDAGGADAGLRTAVKERAFVGPRLFICDLGLAQTGGQGDFRVSGEAGQGCSCCTGRRTLTRIVDGEQAVRRAVRETLHAGADQIKVMASGGIASGIPIDQLQFSDAELAAMVEEAGRAGTYVMAHAYMDEAIRRCVRLGIRSIEHASHIDDETCRIISAAGAFIVPTLSVYEAHAGSADGVSRQFSGMLDASLESLGRAFDHGLSIGHGSDLTGSYHAHQSREFLLRREVLPAHQILRSATVVNAALLGRSSDLGRIAPGSVADLIALDGDPLDDAACLADPDSRFRLIVKDGLVYKNTISD